MKSEDEVYQLYRRELHGWVYGITRGVPTHLQGARADVLADVLEIPVETRKLNFEQEYEACRRPASVARGAS